MHSQTAVAATAVAVHLPALLQKRPVFGSPQALGTRAPGVEAGCRDSEGGTKDTNWIVGSVVLDEAKLHLDAPAKIAIDFPRMSRSCRSRSFSRRSRAFSAA